jgi:Flp pilus assembly protein TadG
MTYHSRAHRSRRRGATTVELAFVIGVLLILIFGIIEFCRLCYMLHIANNAARDAARYAVVHADGGTLPGDPQSISQTNLQDLVKFGQFTYGSPATTVTVGPGMAGMHTSIAGYDAVIFSVDPAGLNETPPVVRPMPGNPPWNTALFGQKIAVRITGEYRPVLPSLLLLAPNIPFQVTVVYSSEG